MASRLFRARSPVSTWALASALVFTRAAVAQAAVVCKQVELPVALAAGQPPAYVVRGELCDQAPFGQRTVELMIHGATYNRDYWDWPLQPETYSYAKYAQAAGYATLNIDQLGAGASDHPPAFDGSMEVTAFTVHQWVDALRAGTFGSAYGRVVLLGHSNGSITAMAEAGTYADVDGVVLTGALHTFSPGAAILLGPLLVNSTAIDALLPPGRYWPTAMDPAFAGEARLGYVTTVPGTRGDIFYNQIYADPAVIAFDEATKDALPITNTPTALPPLLFDTSRIQVPVLLAVGAEDLGYCPTPCDGPLSDLPLEQLYYSAAAELEWYALPDAGHCMNLHPNAATWFAVAHAWIDRRFGTGVP